MATVRTVPAQAPTTRPRTTPGLRVRTIETPELGNRSYVVDDGDAAVVIDPQRDLDRVQEVLEALGTRVTHVLETHVHNDYLTGGFELARRCGAAYGVNAADPVRFERAALHDGDELRAGRLAVRVLATPGHTDTHLAYELRLGGERAVFTGGSLLYGAVGRTDLVDPARAHELARAQYDSARRLAQLPADTRVFPTHGFGSFCAGAGGGARTAGTIADELASNRVFAVADPDEFAVELVASLGAYPTYYAHMASRNLRGPAPVDLTAPVRRVRPQDVADRLADGGVVVDLRERVAYSARHATGTISITRCPQLATYLGWLVPFGTPVTLIGSCAADLDDARRQLARIGFVDIVGTTGPVEVLPRTASYERRTFAELAVERRDDDVVLDVRRTEEFAGGAVRGAVSVPLHELPARLAQLPPGRVWVHCVSGFRAGTAASILHTAGREVVHVDDHVDSAAALGLFA